jgi:hypothetical protein
MLGNRIVIVDFERHAKIKHDIGTIGIHFALNDS